MRNTRRLLGYGAAAASIILLAGACSEQGGAQEEEGEGGSDSAEEVSIALITHQVPGDTFWDIVRSGAEAAAENSNVDLQYHADPEASAQATLIQNAIDQEVDGIATTLATPDSLEGAVTEAVEAGIPVVGLNAGIEEWQDMGVQAYFGTDESLAGEAFGERLNEADAQNAICVIHEQGHVALEARCAGLAETFEGDVENVYVDGSDMTDVQNTITSTLQEDSDIDFVATLGAPFAMTAADAISEAGTETQLATFDTNTELVGAIEDGSVQWAVDQQPYLQGYLAIQDLWLYSTNGNVSGGGEPVLTGPSFVDADNIDDIATYAERGTR